jgi:hypothetical protein
MHGMNLERYMTKITFRSKGCGKDDFLSFLKHNQSLTRVFGINVYFKIHNLFKELGGDFNNYFFFKNPLMTILEVCLCCV